MENMLQRRGCSAGSTLLPLGHVGGMRTDHRLGSIRSYGGLDESCFRGAGEGKRASGEGGS